MSSHFLRKSLNFASDGFKNTWYDHDEHKKTVRAVRIISTTDYTNFSLLFILSWHCFQYETIRRKDYFDIIFLFHKWYVIQSATKATKSNPRAQTRCIQTGSVFDIWQMSRSRVATRSKSIYHSEQLESYDKLVFPTANQKKKSAYF